MLPQYAPPLYPPEMTQPMEAELTRVGVHALKTPESVDAALKNNGLVMVMVNSVCGCAAGNARPAVIESINRLPLAAHWVTVFAGVDREATQRVRTLTTSVSPSSPSFFLFKNALLVFSLPRHQIEGRTPASVAADLIRALREQSP